MIPQEDIQLRFAFHPADQDKGNRHAEVRELCKQAADVLNHKLPDGREKSLAITHLEEVMFWGNAAIARENK